MQICFQPACCKCLTCNSKLAANFYFQIHETGCKLEASLICFQRSLGPLNYKEVVVSVDPWINSCRILETEKLVSDWSLGSKSNRLPILIILRVIASIKDMQYFTGSLLFANMIIVIERSSYRVNWSENLGWNDKIQLIFKLVEIVCLRTQQFGYNNI